MTSYLFYGKFRRVAYERVFLNQSAWRNKMIVNFTIYCCLVPFSLQPAAN